VSRKLGQADLDDLSAFLDGELPPGRAAEVARLIGEDEAWRDACAQLRAVQAALDAWTVPGAPEGLAERVLAGVGAAELSSNDFEDLSACLDGELPEGRASEVRGLVEMDALWRRTAGELRALSAAMDAWSVPAAEDGLADRVMSRVRKAARRAKVFRVAAWAGGAVAAAAAILIAVAMLMGPRGQMPEAPGLAGPTGLGPVIQAELHQSGAYQSVPQAEREDLEREIVRSFAVLRGLYEDRDVIEQFETLQAIDELESEGT
jgi:anti-sigma factor RsiW